jgi:hypothetical protein
MIRYCIAWLLRVAQWHNLGLPTLTLIGRPLWRRPTGCFGSGTAELSPTLDGGSKIHSGPSRVDGRSTPISGRSVVTLQCRRPAEAV